MKKSSCLLMVFWEYRFDGLMSEYFINRTLAGLKIDVYIEIDTIHIIYACLYFMIQELNSCVLTFYFLIT